MLTLEHQEAFSCGAFDLCDAHWVYQHRPDSCAGRDCGGGVVDAVLIRHFMGHVVERVFQPHAVKGSDTLEGPGPRREPLSVPVRANQA